MSLYQYPVMLDQIPFETDSYKEALRQLDSVLGGLKFYHQPLSPEQPHHVLHINMYAQDGQDFICVGSAGSLISMDDVLTQILTGISLYCSEKGLPLIVDPHETDKGQRIFGVAGDLESGLVFRGGRPTTAPKPFVIPRPD